jgi:hypothetical protein
MPIDWQPLIGSSFVSFLLAFMLVKAWIPFAPKRPGEVLLEVHLGWAQRFLVHRTQGLLLVLYLFLGSLPDAGVVWFLPGTQGAGLVGLAIVLALPLRYVLTTAGVSINNGVPWGWKGFRRYDIRPAAPLLRVNALPSSVTVQLTGRPQGRGRAPDRTLYLPVSAISDVTRIIRRCVR